MAGIATRIADIRGLAKTVEKTVDRRPYSRRGSGGGSPSLPAMAALTDIPGLVIDFDASDASTITHSAGLVSAWANKGSYGGQATASGSNRPTTNLRTMGGLNALKFGTTHHLDVSSECFPFTAGPNSVFIVWDNDYGSPTAAFLHLGQTALAGNVRTGLQVDVGNVANRVYQYCGSAAISDPAAPESAGPTVSQMRGTTALAYNYVNGLTRGGANGVPVYSALGAWRIGGDPDVTSGRWNGLICEIVVYDRVLSLDESALVTAYLAFKWGLQAGLNAGNEWLAKDPRSNSRLLNFAAFGDSFTALDYLTNPAERWTNIVAARMGRRIYNGGIGGQKTDQVTQRKLDDEDYFDRAMIYFAGTNGAAAGHTVLGDVQAAVSDLPAGAKFLILPSFNTENEFVGTAGYNAKMANNAAVAAAFPNNFLDVRSMLVALSAPGQPFADAAAYAGDYVCDALRFDNGSSIDSLHLGANGVALMAGYIGDRLIADGW
ncbi:hypothetical protein ATY76_13580 [Rhizobium sp. R339]|uniref:hypothetical protein n=1 Tax=Rhizobium sp. R339 TaxID=1764273 RepID=UPI000B530169|nr:hypothetical protein [Rhizobium sp. R339]OWV67950.1 hypothetical protein ATY76_13580 [Rhizobium sp. R339]